MDIIELWAKTHKPDLPNVRFILETMAGLSKEKVDKIIQDITPEQLVKFYENEQLQRTVLQV